MGIGTVTDIQIVAATLRVIAGQLVKLAEKLDADAGRDKQPKPKKKGKIESARDLIRRMHHESKAA